MGYDDEDELETVTERLRVLLNDLDVGTLQYLKTMCDVVIESKSWND